MSRECVLEVFVLAFCWETLQIPAEAFSLFACFRFFHEFWTFGRKHEAPAGGTCWMDGLDTGCSLGLLNDKWMES